MNAARERGLDLIEVAPSANPPVCKILDYGKYQYLQMKKQREARKSQKVTEIKEVRLRPKINDYHAGFKIKQARKFIEAGMKVKVRVQFRGREITHPEIGREQLQEVVAELADVAIVEQHPNLEGRFMTMVLAPIPLAVQPGEHRPAAPRAPAARAPRPEPDAGDGTGQVDVEGSVAEGPEVAVAEVPVAEVPVAEVPSAEVEVAEPAAAEQAVALPELSEQES